jgi:cell division protein FtsB
VGRPGERKEQVTIEEVLYGEGLTWADERALLKERNAKAREAMTKLSEENQALKATVSKLQAKLYELGVAT